MYRDLSGYPQPQQDALKRLLLRYTRYVIEDSWPAQRRGEVPTGGTDVLSHFERELIGFQPANIAQQAIHAEALHAFNAVVDFRRQRLEAVNYAVPGSLWAVVLIGAVLSIVATYVFNMESFPVHALMTGLLAAMIALLVFFIATTDLPYRGDNGIGPTAYELVLRDLMERGAPQ